MPRSFCRIAVSLLFEHCFALHKRMRVCDTLRFLATLATTTLSAVATDSLRQHRTVTAVYPQLVQSASSYLINFKSRN